MDSDAWPAKTTPSSPRMSNSEFGLRPMPANSQLEQGNRAAGAGPRRTAPESAAEGAVLPSCTPGPAVLRPLPSISSTAAPFQSISQLDAPRPPRQLAPPPPPPPLPPPRFPPTPAGPSLSVSRLSDITRSYSQLQQTDPRSRVGFGAPTASSHFQDTVRRESTSFVVHRYPPLLLGDRGSSIQTNARAAVPPPPAAAQQRQSGCSVLQLRALQPGLSYGSTAEEAGAAGGEVPLRLPRGDAPSRSMSSTARITRNATTTATATKTASAPVTAAGTATAASAPRMGSHLPPPIFHPRKKQRIYGSRMTRSRSCRKSESGNEEEEEEEEEDNSGRDAKGGMRADGDDRKGRQQDNEDEDEEEDEEQEEQEEQDEVEGRDSDYKDDEVLRSRSRPMPRREQSRPAVTEDRRQQAQQPKPANRNPASVQQTSGSSAARKPRQPRVRIPIACDPCRAFKRKCSGHQPCELCSRRGRAEDCKYEPGPGATMILQHAGVTQAILKEAVDQKTKKHKQTLADAAEAARIEAQLKRGALDSDSRRDGSGSGPSGTGGAQRRRGGRRSTLSSRSLAPYQRYKQNEGDEAEEEEGAEEDGEEGEEEEERQGEGENMEGSERPPFGYNSEFYGSGRWSGSSKSRKASASYRKGKAVQPVQAWFDHAGVGPAEDQDDSGVGGGVRARKGLDRRPGQGDWASRLRDGSGGGHSSRQDEDSGCTSTHQDVDTDEESDVGFEFDDEDEETGKAKQNYKRLRDVCHRAPAARRLYSDPDDLVTSRQHRYQRAHPHPHHEATYPGQHQCRPIDVDATSSSSAEQWEQHRQQQPRTMHDSATTRSRYDVMPHPTSNSHSSTLYQGDYSESRQGPAAALSSSSGMYLQSESRGTHRADSFRDEGAGQEHLHPSHQHHVKQSQEGSHADERVFYPQAHHRDQQFSAFRYNSPANRPLLPPPYSLQRAVGGGGAPAMIPTAPPPLPEPRSISGVYCDSTQMSVSFSAPARVSSYRRTNNGLTLAPAFPSKEASLNRPLSPSFKTPVKTPVVPSQRLKDATAAQNALNPRSRSPSAAGRQNIAPLAPSPSAPHDSHHLSLSQNESVQVHQPVAGMIHESQIRPPAPTNQSQSQLKQPLQHQSPHMRSIAEPCHVVSLRPSYVSAQRDRQAANPFAAAAASNVGMRYQHPSAPAPPQPPLLRPLPSSGSIEHGNQGNAQSLSHEQSHEHVQIPQQPRLPTMKPGHAHRWAYSSPSSTSPIMRPMPCSRLLERSRVPPFIQTEGLRSVPGIEVVKQEEEDEIDISPVEEHLDRGKKRSRDVSQEDEESETKRAPRVDPQVAETQGEAQKAEIHQRHEEATASAADKGNDVKAEGAEEMELLSKTEKPL